MRISVEMQRVPCSRYTRRRRSKETCSSLAARRSLVRCCSVMVVSFLFGGGDIDEGNRNEEGEDSREGEEDGEDYQ